MKIQPNDITCGIINYNYSEYLERAILSVINQIVKPSEIIIYDDYSTDNSQDIINCFKRVPEIKIILSKINRGTCGAKDYFVRKAKTNWVFTIDADDTIQEDYIKELINIDIDSKTAIIYTDLILKGDWNGYKVYNEFDAELLDKKNYIHGGSLFRRDIYLKTEGYLNTPNDIYEDWHLWKRIVKLGYIGKYINKPLYNYYRHNNKPHRNERG